MYVYHNFFGAYWAYRSKFPMLIPGQAASRGGSSPPLGLRQESAASRSGGKTARAVLARPKLIGGFKHVYFSILGIIIPAKDAKKWESWKYVWNNMKHHRTKTTWKHFKRHFLGKATYILQNRWDMILREWLQQMLLEKMPKFDPTGTARAPNRNYDAVCWCCLLPI